MIARFLVSRSDSADEAALVEADQDDEESENQPDFFLPAELSDAGDAVPLDDASLCRCCSRIWPSPIAK